jgi:hypothetical protein
VDAVVDAISAAHRAGYETALLRRGRYAIVMAGRGERAGAVISDVGALVGFVRAGRTDSGAIRAQRPRADNAATPGVGPILRPERGTRPA